MKPHYFIFESGKAILGPFNRLRDATVEAKDYGVENPVIRCFETDNREGAERINRDFEKENTCVKA